MSLTNPRSVITEQRLNDFYKGILPYLGGMPEMLANKFSKGDLYSTDEKMIGQWIDGKPIYEKVLRPSSDITITTSMTNIHDVSDLNIETLVEGAVHRFPNQGTSMLETDYDSGYIRAKALGVNLPYYTNGFTVIQYTKTTDTAISIGDDTDYSTEEKIIGTWIDSKPIYQKTISCGALPNNTSKSVAHGISNISKVIRVNGYSLRTSDSTLIPIPFVTGTGTTQVGVIITGTNIIFDVSSDRSTFTETYVTLQYTKTN